MRAENVYQDSNRADASVHAPFSSLLSVVSFGVEMAPFAMSSWSRRLGHMYIVTPRTLLLSSTLHSLYRYSALKPPVARIHLEGCINLADVSTYVGSPLQTCPHYSCWKIANEGSFDAVLKSAYEV